jgi:aryl-alcohol dehydrogenase-like predicted oxidoreductase
VIEACERSLLNLATDVIDLYQIHWPPGTFGNDPVHLEETMGALLQLKEQGKIRAIGVSNFNAELMAEALSYGRIESLQPPYSLFWRFIENKEIPVCREHELTVLAYSPLAQGLLTGKFGPDHRFEEGDHRAKNKLFLPENYQRVQEALSRLRPIAKRNGISLAQLALAWLTGQPNTCAIAGARNADQIVNSAAAGDVALSDEDRETIDKIGRSVTDHLEPAPMMWDF